MTGKKSSDVIEVKIDALHEDLRIHVGNEDKQFMNLDNKLEKLDDRLDDAVVLLGKQQVILDEHVKRTNALEEKHDREVTPLTIQSGQIKIIIKIGLALIAAGGLSGAGLGIVKLVEILFAG